MELNDLLGLINEKRVVCLVGAGGKTSLMYLAAKNAAKEGKKVVVGTTTHILKPAINYAADIDEVRLLWNQGQYAVVGETDKNNSNKLVKPDEALFELIKSESDLILLEADGAKAHPCKIPAVHEPVIVSNCDLVIGVMGMIALGKSMSSCCFRYESNGDWLKLSGNAILDVETATRILSSKEGTMKSVGKTEYVVVLNQCDDEALYHQALDLKNELCEKHKINAVCCSLKNVIE